MKTELKLKTGSIVISSEMGITYIKTFGAVPPAIRNAAAELVKKHVSAAAAVRILKTQFTAAVVAVVEDKK